MTALLRTTLAAAAATLLLAGCERPPIDAQQQGFRGTGMVAMTNPRIERERAAANVAPPSSPAAPVTGTLAGSAYQNVQVLGDVDVGEFTRLMVDITAWVSPKEGCTYCHEPANLAADTKYAKVVARRMLQMTRHINGDWQAHVAGTGVTCYTCHRGQPVPSQKWVADAGPADARPYAGATDGQNLADGAIAATALPREPFSPFLLGSEPIRVVSTAALPGTNPIDIKHTEKSYGLMMHFSEALGVNCTFCHNSQSFSDWAHSRPQRVTAWHGIRMVRDLNNAFLAPLAEALPPERLGPLGDAPKVQCATCHRGVNKPLYGAPMAKDHPALGPAGAPPQAAVEPVRADDAGRGG